jgi:glutamine amidotransferase PdxT
VPAYAAGAALVVQPCLLWGWNETCAALIAIPSEISQNHRKIRLLHVAKLIIASHAFGRHGASPRCTKDRPNEAHREKGRLIAAIR